MEIEINIDFIINRRCILANASTGQNINKQKSPAEREKTSHNIVYHLLQKLFCDISDIITFQGHRA